MNNYAYNPYTNPSANPNPLANAAGAASDGRELGWNDAIENDSSFTLIPAGEYNFTVKSFARGRHAGSEKLPPCNKAVLTISVHTPDGDVDLTHNLFLHTKCEGMLCAFFTCIGQRKHGEKLNMDWNRVAGACGRCKIDVRTWTARDGSQMQSNEIKKFLEPASAAAPAANTQVPGVPTTGTPTFTPGAF